MRYRSARRDDAGHGRLRGRPPAQEESRDPPHPDRHGDRARPAFRPREGAGSRRRRFSDQAGERSRADHARALAGAPQDGDRRAADARGDFARHRNRRAGGRRGRCPHFGQCAGGRRPRVVARAHRHRACRRAQGRGRDRPAAGAVSARGRKLRSPDGEPGAQGLSTRCGWWARCARSSARGICRFC